MNGTISLGAYAAALDRIPAMRWTGKVTGVAGPSAQAALPAGCDPGMASFEIERGLADRLRRRE